MAAVLLSGTGKASTIGVSPGDLLQVAIDSASDGDVIEVESGVYRKNLVVDRAVTLRGLNGVDGKPVIDGGGEGSSITISADGAAIEGLVVTNSGTGPGDAGIMVASANISISGNEIRSNGGSGIRLQRASKSVISKNIISQNRKHGISLEGGGDHEIRENEVKENQLCGIGLWNGSADDSAHRASRSLGNKHRVSPPRWLRSRGLWHNGRLNHAFVSEHHARSLICSGDSTQKYEALPRHLRKRAARNVVAAADDNQNTAT